MDEYVSALKAEEEVWKCVLEELMERRLVAEEEVAGRRRVKEGEARGVIVRELVTNESMGEGRAESVTTHLVVTTSLPERLFIISSLSSRGDTQLVGLCPLTGCLTYSDAAGIEVFPTENAALRYITNTLSLTIAQQTRGVALAGIRNGHLALITSSQLSATLPCGAAIYTVTNAKWFSPPLQTNRKPGSQKEEELLSSFPLTGHFYSEDIDLTSPYPGGTHCPEFHWNEELSKDFSNAGLQGWCVPLLQGYAVSKQIPGTDDRNEYMCLIEKKSRRHPGSRYIARGLNNESAPANEVECQLIVWKEVELKPHVHKHKVVVKNPKAEKRNKELFEMLLSEGGTDSDTESVSTDSEATASTDSSSTGTHCEGKILSSSPRVGAPSSATWASYLWRRGTIPLHWSSELNGKVHIGKAAIVLQQDPHKGTHSYFRSLTDQLQSWKGYEGGGGITCISLLHTDPDHSEAELAEAYSEAVKVPKTEQLGVKMCQIDWHKMNKTLGLDKAPDAAWDIMADTLGEHAFASGRIRCAETAGEVEIRQAQRGVVRVNCADSLDRTNGCAFLVALQMCAEMRRAIRHEEGEFTRLTTIASARQHVGEEYVELLCEMFLQSGDVLSQLYTGTVAAYSDSIRKFTTRPSKAQHSNTMLSVMRRYQNVVYDPWRADSFTAFLRPRAGHKHRCLSDRPSSIIRMSPPLPVDLLHDTEKQLCSLPPDVALLSVVIALEPFTEPTDVALCIRSLNGTVPGAMDIYLGTHLDSLEPVIVNTCVPICNDGTWLVYSIPEGVRTAGCRLAKVSLRDMEGTGMVIGQMRVLGISSRPCALPMPVRGENKNVAKYPDAFVAQIVPHTGDSNAVLEGGGDGWTVPPGVKGRILLVLADTCCVSHIEVECDAKCEFSMLSGMTEDTLVPQDVGKGGIAAFDLIGVGGVVMRVVSMRFKGMGDSALRVKRVRVVGKEAKVDPVRSQGAQPCGTPCVFVPMKAGVVKGDVHVEVKLSEKALVAAVRVKPALSGGDPASQVRELRVTFMDSSRALRTEVITVPKCLKGTALDFRIVPLQCLMIHFDVLSSYGAPCENLGKCQVLRAK